LFVVVRGPPVDRENRRSRRALADDRLAVEMAGYSIRAGRVDELATVQEIERRAARRLASVGLAGAADLPIHPMEELRADCSNGRLLVAADEQDRAVGFALFDLHEYEAHLREVDVVPEHGGRGLGRRLIQEVIARARGAGLRHLALTTFRDVPFNAPFYARLGFRIVEETHAPARLARIRREERLNGYELAPRVAMILDL
jgi:GNAT superfamily N-acetyltransferase